MGANEVLGNALRLYVDTNPGGAETPTVLDCELASDMAFNTDIFVTTGKCDAGIATHKIVGVNYAVNFSGNFGASDPGVERLIDSQMTLAEVLFQWKAVSGKQYTGSSSVSLNIGADTAGVITFSGTLTVNGTLTKATAT
jgi:hypothetical protein